MSDTMKTLSRAARAGLIALVALTLPMLAQAAHHEEAQAKPKAETQAKVQTGGRAVAMEAEAEITAIDLKTRQVTLRGPGGNTFTLQSQDKAIALEDVKVGDSVVVTYIAAMESELRVPTAEEIAAPWVELDEEAGSYTEVIMVIANGTEILKIEKNPYMKQDRPVVAFSWDKVPFKFWGRGICEKAYNSQKALDAELRARIDALALTVHPMMAVDASRMPRGAKLDVRAGKTILTNGNPAEILQPFKFGSLDQVTFSQAAQLQQMVQQSTGAIDSAGIPAGLNGEGTAAGISMGLGAIIKRHKRTLVNFQENFLIPFIEKSACRYMQFVPELYPVKDYKFIATSSLGVVAREYEVTQLVQLLQTMSPESPAYPLLIESIVGNMSLTNRDQIIETLRQSANNPEQQQKEQQQEQMQIATVMAALEKIKAETAEIMSRIEQNKVETQLLPIGEETKRMAVAAQSVGKSEFDKVVEFAKLELKEQEINNKLDIVSAQMGDNA